LEPVPFSTTKTLISDFLDKLLQRVTLAAEILVSGRLPYLKIAAVTFLIALLASLQIYVGLRARFDPPNTEALSFKIRHPLSPLPAELKDQSLYDGYASHNDKLELRLTLPLLGRLSGTGIWTVVVWNHIAAVWFFYILARLATEAVGDIVGGALFVFGLGPTLFGTWFFNDIRYGDGVAYVFLLLSIAFRHPLLSFGFFTIAAFCDERCVAAAPLLLLYFWVSLRGESEKSLRTSQCAAIIAAGGVWLVLRLWLSWAFHLTMGSLMITPDIVRQNIRSHWWDLARVFGWSWMLPASALLGLILQRKWLASIFLIGASAIAIAPAFLVADFARSVGYAFVILLLSVHFLRGDPDASHKYLASILTLNFLPVLPHSILEAGRLVGAVIHSGVPRH
jgi:hypothetical protein